MQHGPRGTQTCVGVGQLTDEPYWPGYDWKGVAQIWLLQFAPTPQLLLQAWACAGVSACGGA